MNYKEIAADEYEKLIQNKKDISNNTFRNTNKLVEDKKRILKLIQMQSLKNNKNHNAKVYNPKNKKNKFQLQYVINKIDRHENISEQYKEFVR